MKALNMNWFVYVALIISGTASAQWSGNIGWASDYYYRGIHQKSSSVSGGADFERNGIYAGIWAADVGESGKDGLEFDGYFGYGGEVGNFTYGVGFTGYYYTGDFDDTYQEINLNAGYGFVTIDVALGEYKNFGGSTEDYAFYSLTLEKNGFFGRYGSFDQDFNGAYVEAGYASSIADFDISFSGLYSDENFVGEATEALILTIGKSFDFN